MKTDPNAPVVHYEPEALAVRMRARARDVGLATAVIEAREALAQAEWLAGWRPAQPNTGIYVRTGVGPAYEFGR